MIVTMIAKAAVVVSSLLAAVCKGAPVKASEETVKLEDGNLYKIIPHVWSGHLYEGGPYIERTGSIETVLAELKQYPKFNETKFLGYNHTELVEKITNDPQYADDLLYSIASSGNSSANFERRAEPYWDRSCTRTRFPGAGGGGFNPFGLFTAALNQIHNGLFCTARNPGSCQQYPCVSGARIVLCNLSVPGGVTLYCGALSQLAAEFVMWIKFDQKGMGNCLNQALEPHFYMGRTWRTDDVNKYNVQFRGC
ncbi:hypothetical protein ABW19_dt0204165 [Dactylella cylindrospora]|nr:hypothetical protein ABW19_dt0204165 [Dactylella cylindrospora]